MLACAGFTATAFGYLLTAYRIPVELCKYDTWPDRQCLHGLGHGCRSAHFPRDVHGDVGHNHAGNTGAFKPIMTAFGVDPIHFGLILICCCGIGFSTPPLGENMFIASGISNQSLEIISLKALLQWFAQIFWPLSFWWSSPEL